MSNKSHTGRPPWAVTAWVDTTAVYIELPMKAGGQPYIVTYPLSEGGLAKALSFMALQYQEKDGYKMTLPKHPETKYAKGMRESRREYALTALTALGIIDKH